MLMLIGLNFFKKKFIGVLLRVNEGQRIRNFGLGAENTHVVDMVLLGMSSGMDTIWFDFNSIR